MRKGTSKKGATGPAQRKKAKQAPRKQDKTPAEKPKGRRSRQIDLLAMLEIAPPQKNGKQGGKRDYGTYTEISLEQFELSLAPDFIARARAFVHQYVKDYNQVKALARMMVEIDDEAKPSASTASKLYWHPYTQRYLEIIRNAMEQTAVVNGTQVLQRLWEEANAPDVPFSSCASTRVNATKTLAKALGVDKPLAAEGPTKGHASGVMLVPYADFIEWADRAEESQAELKRVVEADD